MTAPMTDGSGLQAGLKNRHLSMIAIGGVIGAGLFVGSSSGIATAGPGILLSYALVGTLVVLVMRMLGEMSAANPTSISNYSVVSNPSQRQNHIDDSIINSDTMSGAIEALHIYDEHK